MFNKMKRINNKKCCMKWNNLLLFILVCVVMWGCSDWLKPETHFEWSEFRDGKKIIGFVDDSLVIISDYRRWHKVDDENGDFVGRGVGHQALYLYNYRVQEDGPRWIDSLDNGFDDDFDYLMGQLSDSVIWGKDKGKYSFWKINSTPYKMSLSEKFENCSQKIDVNKMRLWVNKTFIALGAIQINERYLENALDSYSYGDEYCQYAVLDTNAKTLTYKRLEEDLKWIEKCDDVRAWGESVYCLSLKDNPLNLYLLINDEYVDTLINNEPFGWATYTKVGFVGDMLNLGNNVFSINNDTLVWLGVSIRESLKYRINNEEIIEY